MVNKSDLQGKLNFNFVNYPSTNKYDVIIIAVAHKYFIKMGIVKIKSFAKKNNIIFDIKSIFPTKYTDTRL